MSTLGPVACVNVSKDKLPPRGEQLPRARKTPPTSSDAPPVGVESDQSERREDWARPIRKQDKPSATCVPNRSQKTQKSAVDGLSRLGAAAAEKMLRMKYGGAIGQIPTNWARNPK